MSDFFYFNQSRSFATDIYRSFATDIYRSFATDIYRSFATDIYRSFATDIYRSFATDIYRSFATDIYRSFATDIYRSFATDIYRSFATDIYRSFATDIYRSFQYQISQKCVQCGSQADAYGTDGRTDMTSLIGHGWRTSGKSAQNGTGKYFLDTRPLLLSHSFLFLLSDQRLYIVKSMCIYTHSWLYMNYRC